MELAHLESSVVQVVKRGCGSQLDRNEASLTEFPRQPSLTISEHCTGRLIGGVNGECLPQQRDAISQIAQITHERPTSYRRESSRLPPRGQLQ